MVALWNYSVINDWKYSWPQNLVKEVVWNHERMLWDYVFFVSSVLILHIIFNAKHYNNLCVFWLFSMQYAGIIIFQVFLFKWLKTKKFHLSWEMLILILFSKVLNRLQLSYIITCEQVSTAQSQFPRCKLISNFYKSSLLLRIIRFLTRHGRQSAPSTTSLESISFVICKEKATDFSLTNSSGCVFLYWSCWNVLQEEEINRYPEYFQSLIQ